MNSCFLIIKKVKLLSPCDSEQKLKLMFSSHFFTHLNHKFQADLNMKGKIVRGNSSLFLQPDFQPLNIEQWDQLKDGSYEVYVFVTKLITF